MHEQRDGRDVGDGVHRADFVKVYLRHRYAVDGAFGLRDYFIYRKRAGFRLFGHIEAREYRFDLRHARVMVMAATSVFVLMFMPMAVFASFVVDMFFMAMFVPVLAHFFVKMRAAVFVYVRVVVSMLMAMPVFFCALFFAVYQNFHARAFYAAFDAWDGAVFDAGDSERVEPLDEFFGLGQELEQRRREHIAGRAHSAVYV